MGPKVGLFTAHMQQVKAMLKKGVVIPNPKKEILKDLKKMIEDHYKSKGGVILMMDENEDWVLENESELAEFIMVT